MKAFKLSPLLDTFQIIQLMAKSLCTDKFPLMKKLNFPKMINCWSNFPNCIFLAAVCADQVYLVSFRTIQQAGRGHPGAIFVDFWPKPLHTRQFLTKAEIFVTLRQPFTVFRVLKWTFSKCWRGVVDLKGIPNVWTQRNERGDGTNDKWQTFVWRKNLRIPF